MYDLQYYGPHLTWTNKQSDSQVAKKLDRQLINSHITSAFPHTTTNRNKGKKKITLKVDIAKAFVTLSWDFLLSCLEGLELPPFFTRWLKACVCTTSFMLAYNGTVNVYFKGRRGLRQRDPLSPYLFVIAMNCLSRTLNKLASEGSVEYHQNCRKIKLTHLFSADDLLIFIEESMESVQAIL